MRRYGGVHSPGGGGPGQGVTTFWGARRLRRGTTRARALLLWPVPLAFGSAFALIGGELTDAVLLAAAYVLFAIGATLTRTGIDAAAEYEARTLAKPPAFPRKIFGAVATALGVALATALAGYAPLETGVLGLVAAGLHLAVFGADPTRSKGFEGLEGEALEAALTRVETARRLIDEMIGAAARTGDGEIGRRVEALGARARDVLAEIEREPRQLRRARRFLAVWLVGARDATVAFEESRGQDDAEARGRFVALLAELDERFERDRQALLVDDRDRLDVEIDLLRDRLKTEGV